MPIRAYYAGFQFTLRAVARPLLCAGGGNVGRSTIRSMINRPSIDNPTASRALTGLAKANERWDVPASSQKWITERVHKKKRPARRSGDSSSGRRPIAFSWHLFPISGLLLYVVFSFPLSCPCMSCFAGGFFLFFAHTGMQAITLSPLCSADGCDTMRCGG